MNKLLHQLANEARIEVSQRIGYNDRDREVAFEEKFAELIVRECSAFVYNYPEKYLTRNQAREISLSMEELFGVEE